MCADTIPNMSQPYQVSEWVSEWVYMYMYWCFTSHATIFQLYMLRHRCASELKKNLCLQSGYQRHRHFVGFFNVPIQAPTRGHSFYSYSEKLPHLLTINVTLGIRRTYSHLNPRVPTRPYQKDYKGCPLLRFSKIRGCFWVMLDRKNIENFSPLTPTFWFWIWKIMRLEDIGELFQKL